MDPTLAELAAKVAALEKSSGMSNTVNLEVYYYWATAFMVAIHAGFLAYEMGASRAKNVLATGIKNILAFAFIVPTFFFFGWWIYNAFPQGFSPVDAAGALPWSTSMGPNLADNATGVFEGKDGKAAQKSQEEIDTLYREIGKLTVERDFLSRRLDR